MVQDPTVRKLIPNTSLEDVYLKVRKEPFKQPQIGTVTQHETLTTSMHIGLSLFTVVVSLTD